MDSGDFGSQSDHLNLAKEPISITCDNKAKERIFSLMWTFWSSLKENVELNPLEITLVPIMDTQCFLNI